MKNQVGKVILKSVPLSLFCFLFFLLNLAGSVEANGEHHKHRHESEKRLPVDSGPVKSKEKGAYYHIVILSDSHLPGKNLAQKEKVIQTINSWSDVKMVVALGDLCEDRGTDSEYEAVEKLFSNLRKPLYPVTGNHDYFYTDLPSSQKNSAIVAASQKAKLKKFQKAFDLESLFYSKKVGKYLLVFLSPDSSINLTEISDQQLGWLSSELEKNKKTPTIIFFHGPLKGTFINTSSNINVEDYIAHPTGEIKHLLKKNPQVFLWVSGHTHFIPGEKNFASSVNVYKKHITNIHNPDMTRDKIWTNSLFLYPEEVIVRTYDQTQRGWLPALDRTIVLPKL